MSLEGYNHMKNLKLLILAVVLACFGADNRAFAGSFFGGSNIPRGGIIMWSGTVATIPVGWELANGSCAKITCPDLRNKFIVAADADSGGVAKTTFLGAASQTGGSTTIALTQIPAHSHRLASSGNTVDVNSGGFGSSSANALATPLHDPAYSLSFYTTDARGHTLMEDSGGGLPYAQPYFALAFIIKD